MKSNLRANTLESRLVQFAVDIVALVGQLPQNPQAKHIGNQILRSGTAAAPNYGEARASGSRAHFVHKLKICLKELNETSIWLRILQEVSRLIRILFDSAKVMGTNEKKAAGEN